MSQRFAASYNPARHYGPSDWYFAQGFAQEIDATWGGLRRFSVDVYTMKYFRAQTCWFDASLEGIQDRRQATLGMARGILSERDLPTGEVDRIWPMIGVETCSPRLADAICQAYITAPVRTFSTEEKVNEGFADLYECLEINEVMNDAYRAALFTNTVLIWWDGEQFVILTPDSFRLEQGDDGPEVWICRREGVLGQKIRFDIWTAKGVVIHDSEGRVVAREPNKYGRIPGVVLKLAKSLDRYGGGIVEAAEINAWGNLIRLFSTRSALFNGFPFTLGINLGELKEGQRAGPGSILNVNNMTGESGSTPDIKSISQDGKFEELERFRRLAINSFVRNQGLPGYLVDEGAGTPPTGAALQVMERSLNDRRRQHLLPLLKAEQDMLSLIIAIVQTEKAFAIRNSLRSDGVSVKYAAPQTFDDPQKSLTYDQTRASLGLMTPVEMVEKYLAIKCPDDASAMAIVTQNRAFFNYLTVTPPSATPAA